MYPSDSHVIRALDFKLEELGLTPESACFKILASHSALMGLVSEMRELN